MLNYKETPISKEKPNLKIPVFPMITNESRLKSWPEV